MKDITERLSSQQKTNSTRVVAYRPMFPFATLHFDNKIQLSTLRSDSSHEVMDMVSRH